MRAAGGSREKRERWPEDKMVNLNLWLVGRGLVIRKLPKECDERHRTMVQRPSRPSARSWETGV